MCGIIDASGGVKKGAEDRIINELCTFKMLFCEVYLVDIIMSCGKCIEGCCKKVLTVFVLLGILCALLLSKGDNRNPFCKP